jgi:suppressor for copper-sensitivity B
MKKLFLAFWLLLLPVISLSNDTPVKFHLRHEADDRYNLQIAIADGWIVYGPKVSDIGIPLTITAKENIAQLVASFPESLEKQDKIGDEEFIYGYYEGELNIPLTITTAHEHAKLSVALGACSNVCIRVDHDIAFKAPGKAHTGCGLWYYLVLAIIGGLILNLMPCVLPVITLKILNILKYSSKNKKEVLQSLAAMVAGIFVSFFILAIITLTLKHYGHEFGWGFHFQNPKFIYFLCLIVILYASNLWGDFELSVPSSLNSSLPRGYGNISSSFFSGAFATLMATPCTAPFLTTAVSFALSGSALEIMVIYLGIALGFASPYILVMLFPGAIKYLPKPGKWLASLQKFFAILLIITAVWLLYILFGQLGATALSTLVGFLILIKFVITSHFTPRVRSLTLAVLIYLSFTLPFALAAIEASKQQEHLWEEFDPNKLEAYVHEGKIVFVDITANWCATCKFNKFFVLGRSDLMEFFQAHQVVLMRGDLTNPNPVVSDFMRKHNRHGIPFNLIYANHSMTPKVMPELFSKQDIENAIITLENMSVKEIAD